MCTLTMTCLLVACPLSAPATGTFRQITPSSGGNSLFLFCLGKQKSWIFFAFADQISKDGPVVCLQAKRAVQRGATAVIFDVSENPDAIDQVCAQPKNASHARVAATPPVNDTDFFFSSPFQRKQSSPALLTISVCAASTNSLSLVPLKSTRISPAHSAIPGLLSPLTCVWGSSGGGG